ncbi:site-specific integrase, partial [Microvirga sp. 3-52]|nr:site-specific integrase [Microvirga sp. 3-52]
MESTQFALEDYLHFLKIERQLAVNTITSYRRDLTDYVEFIENTEVYSLNAVTRQNIIS